MVLLEYAEAFAEQMETKLFETSAKDNINVTEVRVNPFRRSVSDMKCELIYDVTGMW